MQSSNEAKAERKPLTSDQNAQALGHDSGAKASKNEDKYIDKGSTVTSSKRKGPTTDPSSSKAPRRSKRSAPSFTVNHTQLLQFILSPSCLHLSRPLEETSFIDSNPDLKTYTSDHSFTPFEELLSAVVLSRPISHALGLRSIRTILNPPYNLSKPQTLLQADEEGIRKALEQARTRHRQKTAMELKTLAEVIKNGLGEDEEDVSLTRVRRETISNQDQEREFLRKNIKGLGKTGLDIFGRRIQSLWVEWYPFIDGRTSAALEKIGLPADAEELRDLIEKNWKELDTKNIDGDENEKERRVFVRVLERAVGVDLEGNVDEFHRAAGKRVKKDELG